MVGGPEVQLDLRACVAELTGDLPTKDLVAAFEQLATSYTDARPRTNVSTATEAAAYAIGRGVATNAAVERVLGELAAARPDWRPKTVLDLGAGIGSASWAAASIFDSLEEVTLVERSDAMITLGRELTSRSDHDALTGATWIRGDTTGPQEGSWDLVIAAYVLGEIHENERRSVVARWFDATSCELVIVDVGSPKGFEAVLVARDSLIERGATITAPCPHEAVCPLAGTTDWCHFGARVPRSRMHRQVKGGDRSFEDEKFSYVSASKQGSVERASRILRRPDIGSGLVRLHLCAPTGLEQVTVSRRHGQTYKRARKAAWGDAW